MDPGIGATVRLAGDDLVTEHQEEEVSLNNTSNFTISYFTKDNQTSTASLMLLRGFYFHQTSFYFDELCYMLIGFMMRTVLSYC